MSFRRKNYPEVLDNLLTQIIGGVAAETHPFPPPGSARAPFDHALEQPRVKQLVSVYGTRNGESRLFRNNTDYELRADKQTLRWKNNAELPDAGTLVHVNYLREDDPPTLTDLQVGSVVRTLTESVALEIARLYAQLEAVYDAGFIDSATGSALDKVVALLGITRIDADRPSTKVQFTRAAGTPGSIAIVAGTRIIDAQAKFEYETVESVTLAPNQNSITVAARDLEEANDPVAADTLTVLPVPIAGISAATNPAPAARAASAESDAELRRRAKSFLYGSERATLGALQQVLARQQVKGEILEVADTPGLVRVQPLSSDLSPERREQLLADLRASRPAGVVVELQQPVAPAKVNLAIELQTAERLPEVDVRRAHDQVRSTIADYFARLAVRDDASLNQIVGRILAVDGVSDVDITSAQVANQERLDAAQGIIDLAGEPTELGELRIADRNLPTAVSVIVRFAKSQPAPDPAAIESALGSTFAYLNGLDPSAAPSRRRLELGKFILVVPLPGKPGASLQQFDDSESPPALPDLTALGSYGLSVLIHQTSGVSLVLDDTTANYQLVANERLLLDGLDLSAE